MMPQTMTMTVTMVHRVTHNPRPKNLLKRKNEEDPPTKSNVQSINTPNAPEHYLHRLHRIAPHHTTSHPTTPILIYLHALLYHFKMPSSKSSPKPKNKSASKTRFVYTSKTPCTKIYIPLSVSNPLFYLFDLFLPS
jgi:hypothetical protein